MTRRQEVTSQSAMSARNDHVKSLLVGHCALRVHIVVMPLQKSCFMRTETTRVSGNPPPTSHSAAAGVRLPLNAGFRFQKIISENV